MGKAITVAAITVTAIIIAAVAMVIMAAVDIMAITRTDGTSGMAPGMPTVWGLAGVGQIMTTSSSGSAASSKFLKSCF